MATTRRGDCPFRYYLSPQSIEPTRRYEWGVGLDIESGMVQALTIALCATYALVLGWLGFTIRARNRGNATGDDVARAGIAYFVMNLIMIAWGTTFGRKLLS